MSLYKSNRNLIETVRIVKNLEQNNLVNNNKQFTKYLHTGISVLEYTKEGVIYHIIKLINFENINL